MPDFQTAVIRVLIAGTLIMGIGFTGLWFVFRAFDSKNSERKPVLLICALLLFIMTCCVLLYIVSR